jgi:hypothetical protein
MNRIYYLLFFGLIFNILVAIIFSYVSLKTIIDLQSGQIIYQQNGVPSNISAGFIFFLFEFIFIIISILIFNYWVIKKKIILNTNYTNYFIIISISLIPIIWLLNPLYRVKNSVYDDQILSIYLYFFALIITFLFYSIIAFTGISSKSQLEN